MGIIVFFDHFKPAVRRQDPTPMEVQMRTYEEDVNNVLIHPFLREILCANTGIAFNTSARASAIQPTKIPEKKPKLQSAIFPPKTSGFKIVIRFPKILILSLVFGIMVLKKRRFIMQEKNTNYT